tara:strand:+ start:216 stop:620 length:405 start_codon:yes stop_codon:yes gene_type:complete
MTPDFPVCGFPAMIALVRRKPHGKPEVRTPVHLASARQLGSVRSGHGRSDGQPSPASNASPMTLPPGAIIGIHRPLIKLHHYGAAPPVRLCRRHHATPRQHFKAIPTVEIIFVDPEFFEGIAPGSRARNSASDA